MNDGIWERLLCILGHKAAVGAQWPTKGHAANVSSGIEASGNQGVPNRIKGDSRPPIRPHSGTLSPTIDRRGVARDRETRRKAVSRSIADQCLWLARKKEEALRFSSQPKVASGIHAYSDSGVTALAGGHRG